MQRTSDKGHSEKRTNLSGNLKVPLYPKITSKRGQSLYKGQKAGSQVCPLLGGSVLIVVIVNDMKMHHILQIVFLRATDNDEGSNGNITYSLFSTTPGVLSPPFIIGG